MTGEDYGKAKEQEQDKEEIIDDREKMPTCSIGEHHCINKLC